MFEKERSVAALDVAHAAMCAASHDVLEQVAVLDERASWEEDGATSMTSWLSGRYCLTYATALEWVRVARALRLLPAIKETYRKGGLSWDQLRPLSRFATNATDGHWAVEAPSCSAAYLWTEARRHERETRERAEELHRMRSVTMQWDEEQEFLYLNARLPKEQGVRVQSRIEERAKEIPSDPNAWDSNEAGQADAMTELICEDGGEASTPNTTLVVHADAAVLAGSPRTDTLRLSETASGIRLAEETVRRLACDARREWVLESEGRPVGVGRADRSPPPWLRRLVHHRDGGRCRFPGCHRRKWVVPHHLVWWTPEGRTDPDNLMLLCHTHHRLVHEGGWSIRGTPSGVLRFHDPRGRPLPTGPPRPEGLQLPMRSAS